MTSEKLKTARSHVSLLGAAADMETVNAALDSVESMRATLHGIAYAKHGEWQDGMNTADDFVRWAQSRARNALGDWPEKPPRDVPCECASVGPDYCPRHTP